MTDARAELAHIEDLGATPVPYMVPAFDSPADYLSWRATQVEEVYRRILKPDVHYGVIPGTNRPTLLKAGAEFLLTMFDYRFRPRIDADLSRIDVPGRMVSVVIYGAIYNTAGEEVGGAWASCSSEESRWQRPHCPQCGAGVFHNRGRNLPDWKLKLAPYTCRDKCGWEGENPAAGFSADLVNTIIKMAEKRAKVAAALTVTGASGYFTQDMEDKAAPVAPAEIAADPPLPDARAVGTHPELANGDRVKREVLAKVMHDRGMPRWADCTDAQRDEAITLARGLIEVARATLGIAWEPGTELVLTDNQARQVLTLIQQGGVSGATQEQEIAPGPHSGAVVEHEDLTWPSAGGPNTVLDVEDPFTKSVVDQALDEQRWSQVFELMDLDLSGGTNAVIEARVRKLYRLMGELGLWPTDQLHTDLAPHAHWSDLGRKAEFQWFAKRAQDQARATLAEQDGL